MAMASLLADPSRFVISVADGCAHILVPVLGFLERVASTHRRDDPVVPLVSVVSLALLALIAYRGDVTQGLEQAAAALLPAAVLGWHRNPASIKLAVGFRICGFVLYMISNVLLAARN